jgi:chromosome segregation ATPase
LKGLQKDYNAEVERRQSLSRELAEIKSRGDDDVSSLQGKLRAKSIEIDKIESEHRDKFSSLTNLLNEYQRKYEAEVQRRHNVCNDRSSVEVIQLPKLKNGEMNVTAGVAVENETLRQQLQDLQKDYNLKTQVFDSENEQLRQALRVKSDEMDLSIENLENQITVLTSMLKELQDNYDFEVQNRGDMSKQVTVEESDRLEVELSELRARYDEEIRRRHDCESTLTAQKDGLLEELKELQKRYDDEVQRRQALSRQVVEVLSPQSSPGKLGNRKSLQAMESDMAAQNERLQGELEDIQSRYDEEVLRRQMLSKQVIEITSSLSSSPRKGMVSNESELIANAQCKRLEVELSELRARCDEEIRRRHDCESTLTAQKDGLLEELKELQKRYDDEVQRRRDAECAASVEKHGLLTELKELQKRHDDETQNREAGMREKFIPYEEFFGLQTEIETLQREYEIETQRRQSMSRQLAEMSLKADSMSGNDLEVTKLQKALLEQANNMKSNTNSSEKQISLLTEILKDTQQKYEDEATEHRSLRKQIEKNVEFFDMKRKYEEEVKHRESLGEQLLDECSKSAKRSEDAMTTIRILKESNKMLEEKSAHNRSATNTLESRCVALEQQLSKVPPSLLVASAEVRVMEAKMIEFERVCQEKISTEQRNAAMRLRYVVVIR